MAKKTTRKKKSAKVESMKQDLLARLMSLEVQLMAKRDTLTDTIQAVRSFVQRLEVRAASSTNADQLATDTNRFVMAIEEYLALQGQDIPLKDFIASKKPQNVRKPVKVMEVAFKKSKPANGRRKSKRTKAKKAKSYGIDPRSASILWVSFGSQMIELSFETALKLSFGDTWKSRKVGGILAGGKPVSRTALEDIKAPDSVLKRNLSSAYRNLVRSETSPELASPNLIKLKAALLGYHNLTEIGNTLKIWGIDIT